MADAITIDDLNAPQLSEVQKQALAFGDANPIALTEQAVLETARQRTGLSDFGPDDFRERLGLLLSEWNGDAAMTNLWRMTLFGYATRYAANRLLIHDTLQRHPEIHDEVIDRPIVIAGLPRSGTTHLINLIAADTRLQSLPLWESYEPVPLPGEAMLPGGVDPRFGEARSHRVSGRRQEAEDAAPPPDDALWHDPRRLSRQMGPARRLSDGRARLCRKAPRARQGNRPRYQGARRRTQAPQGLTSLRDAAPARSPARPPRR